jgi:hypothetical protein
VDRVRESVMGLTCGVEDRRSVSMANVSQSILFPPST